MFRRLLTLVFVLMFLASCVAWIWSYVPSSFVRYRGWWIERTLTNGSNLGLRCGSGELLVWWIKPQGTRAPKPYQNRTKPAFGFTQTTDLCELEGTLGVPLDAVEKVTSQLFGQAAWMPMWPLVVLAAIQPTAAFAIHLKKRKSIRAGLCSFCGYKLTGNVSGICPECGIEIKS